MSARFAVNIREREVVEALPQSWSSARVFGDRMPLIPHDFREREL